MANWRTGHGVDNVGSVSQANIDTWYASKDRTVEHGWDDAHAYVTQVICQGIPSGHTVKHGVQSGKYFVKISGDTINKTWS